ncbi:11337_t:CDS:2, partial [Acaulospora morrowiae]
GSYRSANFLPWYGVSHGTESDQESVETDLFDEFEYKEEKVDERDSYYTGDVLLDEELYENPWEEMERTNRKSNREKYRARRREQGRHTGAIQEQRRPFY